VTKTINIVTPGKWREGNVPEAKNWAPVKIRLTLAEYEFLDSLEGSIEQKIKTAFKEYLSQQDIDLPHYDQTGEVQINFRLPFDLCLQFQSEGRAGDYFTAAVLKYLQRKGWQGSR
jgi:hypothetical protein